MSKQSTTNESQVLNQESLTIDPMGDPALIAQCIEVLEALGRSPAVMACTVTDQHTFSADPMGDSAHRINRRHC